MMATGAGLDDRPEQAVGPLQLLLDLLTGAGLAHQAQDPPVRQPARAHLRHDQAAVSAEQVALPEQDLSRPQPIQSQGLAVQVPGRDQVRQGEAQQVLEGVAQHLATAGVDLDQVPLSLGDENAVCDV